MPARLIQDTAEAIRWMEEEGLTYAEMTERHLAKYHIYVSQTAWSNFRRRQGLGRRIARNSEVIPWAVEPRHQMRYIVQMLRFEARAREGRFLTELEQHKLSLFKQRLEEMNAVIHYEPETEDGFYYVPREEGDEDIVRMPPKVTKRGADKT